MSRSIHTEQVRYIVAVLFLHGDSEAQIAETLRNGKLASLTKGGVSGIINRAGDGTFRNLSLGQRQEWLDKLGSRRLDGGRLPQAAFRAVARAKDRR